MNFSVIKSGAIQYKVQKGETLRVEKLKGKKGDKVQFDVLLTSDEKGSTVDIGKPFLSNKAEGEIEDQLRAKKISVIKFKRKTRYRRNVGHRQPYTLVKIIKI